MNETDTITHSVSKKRLTFLEVTGFDFNFHLGSMLQIYFFSIIFNITSPKDIFHDFNLYNRSQIPVVLFLLVRELITIFSD